MPSASMGMFRVRIRVFSPDEKAYEELEAIVDTGSVFTWIPKTLAERLGYAPRQLQRFRTVDRGGIERPIGDAIVECYGQRGSVGIVFAESGDATVLGVTALERLGFEVDPIAQVLRRMDALPAFA